MENLSRISEFLSISSGYGYGSGSGYGSGDGDGSGDGSGDGFGFGYGYGSGDGSGFGYGYGYGSGSGYGSGYGDGDGDGSGDGFGFGYGYGSGDGSGFGYGDGYGSGDGDGSGFGDGSGDGIKSFCGRLLFAVDGVLTSIENIHGNIARGHILRADLTTKKCYIIKQGNLFAHGETLREARAALAEKLFDSMSTDERIDAFLQAHKLGVAYSNRDLYDWHHRLTGSCEMGRKAFAEDHEIDVERGEMTVEAFIDLTWDAYGGDIIKKLAAACGYQPAHLAH